MKFLSTPDVSAVPPEIKITEDQRARLRDTFQSEGWKVVEAEILPKFAEMLERMVLSAPGDHRYHQGAYWSFWWLLRFLRQQAAEPEQEKDLPNDEYWEGWDF